MKHLLLNKDNVIIDVVDDVKYVKKNENNLVVLCHQHDAQGYIASNNESIHAKFGTQFRLSFKPDSGVTNSGAETRERFSVSDSRFWKKSLTVLIAIWVSCRLSEI